MTTDAKFEALCDLQRQIREEIALAALRRIAWTVRQQAPAVAYVGLVWSDQGPWLVPDGYMRRDRTEVTETEGFDEDDLDDRLGGYASALGHANASTWQPFTDADTSHPPWWRDRYWLRTDERLAIEEPEADTAPAQLRFRDAEVAWYPRVEMDPSDMYALEAYGARILLRRREDSLYVHIDTQGLPQQPKLPLAVEVNNAGENTYT